MSLHAVQIISSSIYWLFVYWTNLLFRYRSHGPKVMTTWPLCCQQLATYPSQKKEKMNIYVTKEEKTKGTHNRYWSSVISITAKPGKSSAFLWGKPSCGFAFFKLMAGQSQWLPSTEAPHGTRGKKGTETTTTSSLHAGRHLFPLRDIFPSLWGQDYPQALTAPTTTEQPALPILLRKPPPPPNHALSPFIHCETNITALNRRCVYFQLPIQTFHTINAWKWRRWSWQFTPMSG